MARPKSEPVAASAFFQLIPGHWWQFKNLANNEKARVECLEEAADKIRVKINVGSKVTEHLLQVKLDQETHTEQYTLLKSNVEGQAFTWGSGLALPNPWKVGDSVSAISNEGNAATGNRVRLTAKLEENITVGFPSPTGKPLSQADKDFNFIQIDQLLQDSGLSTTLAHGKMVFGVGRGIVAANFNIFGVQIILEAEGWGVT